MVSINNCRSPTKILVYPSFGYDVILLPKVSVAARADFVVGTLTG